MADKTELPVSDERPDRCETCRFWSPEDHGDSHGYCRRYPPTIGWEIADQAIPEYNGCWYQVHESDWCGEWQGKGAPPAPLPAKIIPPLDYPPLWSPPRVKAHPPAVSPPQPITPPQPIVPPPARPARGLPPDVTG